MARCPLTPDQQQFVRENYFNMGALALAERLNVGRDKVRNFAGLQKLRVNPEIRNALVHKPVEVLPTPDQIRERISELGAFAGKWAATSKERPRDRAVRRSAF